MSAVPLTQYAVHLRPQDNIAVAARGIPANTALSFNGGTVLATAGVELGHKFAVANIKEGDAVYKFGQIIGFATKNIASGEHVHTHNIKAEMFARDYAFGADLPAPLPPPSEYRTWMGFDRGPDKPEHQRYGSRNYLAVISTVNCSASTSKYITERIKASGILKQYPNVDGVIPIVHKQGCGHQYEGPDHRQLERTLAGFANHPNVGGYILIGLGCEIVQARELVANQHLVQLGGKGAPAIAPTVLTIQETGGIGKTTDAGVHAVIEMLPRLNDIKRTQLSAKHILLGTNCGGSDGNSGITANPALGIASDLVIQQGGTSILAETPEIYGAEHVLTRRAVSAEVGQKLVDRIKWWEWYTGIFGAEINNNPSPGNKKGGLTTIYEKSLGAIAKAGSTAMVDVVQYAEPVKAKGFVVMDTPGYDPVSMTGVVAGGANVCVFTTGRGSVYGCKPAPCLKVATNTPLYERMEGDMDLNAGVILDGVAVEKVGRELFEMILATASGELTKSEKHGVGEEEFAPWQIGPTL
jgi:altronate hydrolase